MGKTPFQRAIHHECPNGGHYTAFVAPLYAKGLAIGETWYCRTEGIEFQIYYDDTPEQA